MKTKSRRTEGNQTNVPFKLERSGRKSVAGRCPVILIIDDDQGIVDGTSMRLRAQGYEVLEAYDGPHGIAKACEKLPDLILLDVRMPGMEGLEVLERLRARAGTRTIPTVMLSASLADRKAALDAGARYFLSKPYRKETLLAAITSAMSEAGSHATEPAKHAPAKC